jgi:hypothetical protein
MDIINYETLAYYAFGRANKDYNRLYRITKTKAYFVVRAQSRIKFKKSIEIREIQLLGLNMTEFKK